MTALLKEKAHYLLAVSWNKGTLLLECRVIFFFKEKGRIYAKHSTQQTTLCPSCTV